MAIPGERLVSSLPVPPHPIRQIRAVANAHGLRGPRRHSAGGRRRTVRALGEPRKMNAAAARDTAEGAIVAGPGASLEQRIKAQAYGLGFDLVGLTRTGPAQT